MKLEAVFDEIHTSVTRRWWTQLFTAFVRCLLAVGFIPPSIPKILHRPFTILPDSDPVGAYFHALYNTGFYYEFIGWSQVIAAVLLLIPRTSHIGAMMFLPIIVNIAVLTSSVGFRGTWLLTMFMSLAGLWVFCWEYDRLKPMFLQSRIDKPRKFRYQFIAMPAFFAIGGFVMGGLWKLIGLGAFSNYLTISLGLTVFGLIFGIAVALHYRFMPVGRLAEDDSLQ
jgi:hypothetical protein